MAVALKGARHYPLFLDLTGRRCVVVGGGAVAERKVAGLLAAAADIKVVSPRLTARLQELAAARSLHHVARAYRYGDLADARLAFVATDDRSVNEAVALEARERGVWLNAADDPRHCDFILPAVLERGGMTVAVGTGGASPAVAAVIRDDIAAHLGEECGTLLDVAAEVRRALVTAGRASNAEIWRRALKDGALRRLVADGRCDEARARLVECLGEHLCR